MRLDHIYRLTPPSHVGGYAGYEVPKKPFPEIHAANKVKDTAVVLVEGRNDSIPSQSAAPLIQIRHLGAAWSPDAKTPLEPKFGVICNKNAWAANKPTRR
jgi:hypothetical protein